MNRLKNKIFHCGTFGRMAIFALAAFAAVSANAAPKHQRGFAIVVDPQTYNNVRADIDAYANAVNTYEGLKTYTIVDRWGVPDSIRAALYKLYTQKVAPIEGAVFIGDIPVAMIRDAQHLTSAFKMDQTQFNKQESSVPSDRFYDDFGLKFKYLERDSAETLYFYYTLLGESQQYLAPDIYSGRIKANDEFGTTKYFKISRYLRKAIEQKKTQNYLDQTMFFSGNGYVSGSLDARMDEKTAMLDNFPWLRNQRNGIEYIDHVRENPIKTRLKNELQRPELDLAVLHHHGDVEIQYMNGSPVPENIHQEIEDLKYTMRDGMRYYKSKNANLDSMRKVISARYDSIPLSWFDNAFDPATAEKDSLLERSLNLYIDEFAKYNPQARLVILDACFNGSFHKNKYIAGAYIFGTGNTTAVIGNSVNVLQDKWCDRYVGMMALGMRVGRMVQLNPFLEGHIIGDPTFHFTPYNAEFDVNEAIASAPLSFWKKQLSSKSAAVRCMALRKVVDLDRKNASPILLEHYKNSDAGVERLEALVLLSTYNNSDFLECLKLGVNDGYEMAQRFAVKYIARVGDLSLAPAIVNVASRNNTSQRIEFDAEEALNLFPEQPLVDAFEQNWKNVHNYLDSQKVHDDILHAIKVFSNKWTPELMTIYDDTTTMKRRIQRTRYMRNYPMHSLVTPLLKYVQTCPDAQEQLTLIEALGWFDMSYRRAEIADVMKQMSTDTKYSDEIRNEALKTYNRINKQYK